MATITIHVNELIKEKVKETVKKDGITLTFLINQLLHAYAQGNMKFKIALDADQEYIRLSHELTETARKKLKNKKLPSLEEQLSDI